MQRLGGLNAGVMRCAQNARSNQYAKRCPKKPRTNRRISFFRALGRRGLADRRCAGISSRISLTSVFGGKADMAFAMRDVLLIDPKRN